VQTALGATQGRVFTLLLCQIVLFLATVIVAGGVAAVFAAPNHPPCVFSLVAVFDDISA
jgi:hypothetical protein